MYMETQMLILLKRNTDIFIEAYISFIDNANEKLRQTNALLFTFVQNL